MTDTVESLAQAVAALERRTENLESAEAVRALHATFVRAVADRQFDTLAGYFDSDAVIDMRTHGAKQGEAAIAEHFSHMVNSPLRGASYLLSSPVVTADGDEAVGRWTWHRFHTEAYAGGDFPAHGIWEEGQYTCTYRRGDDGRWRFSAMRFRMVRPDADPEGTPVGPGAKAQS
ncbi:nuclear transport factor 2 family protein [Subtercola sp. YIM 133946]|uniref:nuclear transport factor 2 family protein n=1 Tax=Subtercola sp. YIM 133946 TaxID=3118909 RepID=UPI002F94BE0E